MKLQRIAGGLAGRIVLPLALALVVVFGATSVYLGHGVRDEGVRELNERSRLLADTLAHNAELPLLARDVKALESLLEGAASDPDLIDARVIDEQNKELASFVASRRWTSALVVESAVHTETVGDEAQEASAFALDPGAGAAPKRIGVVRLRLSTERMSARTRRLQAQIAAAGAGLLLLCVFIGLGVVRIIGAPLRALVGATRRIAAGDLSARVAPSSTDEIGELGEAFNRMAADLEIARAEVLRERAQLERRVALRTAELERAQESLIHSEKMSAVGQLVAGVAHELNNPLTVILGFSGLLLENSPDAATRRQLDLLAAEAERSRKIVQNLLAFARKQKGERASVDVNTVVSKTVELQAYQLRNQSIRVQTELADDLEPVSADFGQLQQVVLNLLVNAEQAIKDSGKGSRILIATRRSAEYVEIVVEDDGPGISASHRARVFEPFFTTKEVGRGTGLGLSICYGIVADHGGLIVVESEENVFTRFTIRLQAIMEKDAQASGPEVSSAFAAARESRLRVLVIDDDPSILCLVEEALRNERVSIETAHGGSEGIKRLSQNVLYDVVLSDVRMPGVDGRAVLQFVRENRPELEERLVFATGDVASAEAQEFIERSGRPVLQKPYTITALREAVLGVAAAAGSARG